MIGLYRDLIDAEWRQLDDMLRVDTLTAELLEIVRQLDHEVDQWPENLERLAYLVMHGMEMPDQCERCGSRAPVRAERQWCDLCCDEIDKGPLS